jgi:hypothetical protein
MQQMCESGQIMTIVHLSGGLGNQLFQYFDGAYRSIQSSETLTLDFSQIYLGKVSHGSSLKSIELPVEYTSINDKLPRYRIFLWKSFLSLKHSCSRALQFKEKNNSHEQSISIQNKSSFEKITKIYPEWKPNLVSPSSWFLNLLEKTQNKGFIALHLRQGDYLEDRNFSTIGVLAPEYYLKAIHALSQELGLLPIWIFSDSMPEESFTKYLTSDRFIWISPPAGTDPAESMFLMSRASGIVLANSTFSWWAAKFGSTTATICSPSPWFKDLKQPENLIASNWRKLPSIWMMRESNHDV